MLVLHPVTVCNDTFFPMVERVIALGVTKAEEIVLLLTETGLEVARLKDGLGKDYLRELDTVLLQCRIEILDGQVAIIIMCSVRALTR